MSVSYGWYLSRSLTREQVIEFVRTMPNEGLTEQLDGGLFDVWKNKKGVVQIDPCDGDPKGKLAKIIRKAERGGSISVRVASHLELAKCIVAEGVGKTKKQFAGYRCRDLETVFANVGATLLDEDFDDGADGTMLGSLEGCLRSALTHHIAVVFE